MPKDKVYKPEEIEETPYPEETTIPIGSEKSSPTNDVYQPQVTKAKSYPTKRTSFELLSSALNTRSKKILKEFKFEHLGAIRIGNFKESEYGDITISPAGILGRDSQGATTFAIDGETGNALFKGEVRADDFVIADNGGLVSLSNFRSGTVNSTSTQKINSTSYVDVDSMDLDTANLSRESIALIIFTTNFNVGFDDIGSPYGNWEGIFSLFIDGVEQGSMRIDHLAKNDASLGPSGDGFLTSTCHFLTSLDPGTHNLKVKSKVVNNSGVGAINCYKRTLSYSILGS